MNRLRAWLALILLMPVFLISLTIELFQCMMNSYRNLLFILGLIFVVGMIALGIYLERSYQP